MENVFSELTGGLSVATDEGSPQTVDFVMYQIKTNKLQLSPVYQRNSSVGEWKTKLANECILSLFQGIGVGQIKISIRKSDNCKYVIDGKQRLTTIYKFYNGEYAFTNYKGEKYYFTEPEKKYGKYKVINDSQRAKFNNLKLNIITYYNTTIEEEQAIFIRVQNGVKLTQGELAMAIGNKWTKFSQELNEKFGEIINDIYGGKPGSEFRFRGSSVLFCSLAIIDTITKGTFFEGTMNVLEKFANLDPGLLTDQVKKDTITKLETLIKYEGNLAQYFANLSDGRSRKSCQKSYKLMLIITRNILEKSPPKQNIIFIYKELMCKYWFVSGPRRTETDFRRIPKAIHVEIEKFIKDLSGPTEDADTEEEPDEPLFLKKKPKKSKI